MKNAQAVWIVSGKSESGDDYGPWVFKSKPSKLQLETVLRCDCPGEWDDDGPGSFGSYVHLSKPRKVDIE